MRFARNIGVLVGLMLVVSPVFSRSATAKDELKIVLRKPVPQTEVIVIQQELDPNELPPPMPDSIPPDRRIRLSFFQQTPDGHDRRVLWIQEFNGWGKSDGPVDVVDLMDATVIDGSMLVYVYRGWFGIFADIIDIREQRFFLSPVRSKLLTESSLGFQVKAAKIDGSIAAGTPVVTLEDARGGPPIRFLLQRDDKGLRWISESEDPIDSRKKGGRG